VGLSRLRLPKQRGGGCRSRKLTVRREKKNTPNRRQDRRWIDIEETLVFFGGEGGKGKRKGKGNFELQGKKGHEKTTILSRKGGGVMVNFRSGRESGLGRRDESRNGERWSKKRQSGISKVTDKRSQKRRGGASSGQSGNRGGSQEKMEEKFRNEGKS